MTHIEQRTDTAAALAATNPDDIHKGEAVHESDTGKWKIGDGVSAYNDLPYKSGVDSVAGQTGAVTLHVLDVEDAAPLGSPAFTGTPSAPTRATSDNSTSLATTAFVKAALALLTTGAPGLLDDFNEIAAAIGDNPNFASDILASLATKAPLANPAFTGNPTAPTPATADNDTSIATTAHVKAAIAAAAPTLLHRTEYITVNVSTTGTFSWVIPGGGFANNLRFADAVQAGDPAYLGHLKDIRILPSSSKTVVNFKADYAGVALVNANLYCHAMGD